MLGLIDKQFSPIHLNSCPKRFPFQYNFPSTIDVSIIFNVNSMSFIYVSPKDTSIWFSVLLNIDIIRILAIFGPFWWMCTGSPFRRKESTSNLPFISPRYLVLPWTRQSLSRDSSSDLDIVFRQVVLYTFFHQS